MGRWRVFSLPKIEALANAGGYSGLAALSQFSAAMLLSVCRLMRDPSRWEGVGDELTDVEKDDIDEYVSQAEYELMLATLGLIMPYAGTTIPDFTLLCDGTQYAKVDYPDLYDVLDAAFIVDANNFVVPDLSDRFIYGVGVGDVGDVGGAEVHNLDVGQLATHSHSTVPHSHTYTAPVPAAMLLGAGVPAPNVTTVIPSVTVAAGVTVNNAGSGDDVDHMPPFVVLSYVIVAGN